jgi:hypothetical protein
MSASVTKLLLAIHVLAAIIAIGPVTVAASMYPAATRRADLPTLRTLHRICRVYAALGVVVPVFGLATAKSLGVLGDAWLLISIALTLLAATVLALLVLPGQAAVLAALAEPPAGNPLLAEPATGSPRRAEPAAGSPRRAEPANGKPLLAEPAARDPRLAAQAGRLGMLTGIFNLLWAVVVVLMIVRPGSTTGV